MATKRIDIYSGDGKLLILETVTTTLAIKDGMKLDRGEVLDTYNFLALLGYKDPVLRTKPQVARFHNFKALREIIIGRSKSSDLISMFEVARSCSKPPISAAVILKENRDRARINIRM